MPHPAVALPLASEFLRLYRSSPATRYEVMHQPLPIQPLEPQPGFPHPHGAWVVTEDWELWKAGDILIWSHGELCSLRRHPPHVAVAVLEPDAPLLPVPEPGEGSPRRTPQDPGHPLLSVVRGGQP